MTNPFGTQVNITTSKEQILSSSRALTTALGLPPVITAATDWGSVFTSGGAGPVAAADTMVFTGAQPDGTAVAATFTINATDSPNNTVQDLLDWLENNFNAEATVDFAGRLVLTDRLAGSASYNSQLAITSIAGSAPAVFGAGAFANIIADISGEDGSHAGDVVTTNFDSEALASTQYANASTTVFQDQDGYASGFLQSVSVDTEGVITGQYSNGQVLKRAQVALATFNNLAGLFKEGGNIFTETTESGAPVTGAPGTNGLGSIAPNALEQSNVDIGTEFVKLITTQRGFQANSKIISTTDEMLADLINIKR
jgi:flagellar hook protein FlgE